jgi:hypothetical protein
VIPAAEAGDEGTAAVVAFGLRSEVGSVGRGIHLIEAANPHSSRHKWRKELLLGNKSPKKTNSCNSSNLANIFCFLAIHRHI